MKKRLKIIIPTLITILIFMTFVSIGQEVQLGFKQNLAVWIGSNKITYNNQDVTQELNTVVINNITYIPLRNAANLFGKEISWNDPIKTVEITDVAGSGTAEANQLRAEIAILKAELEEKNTDTISDELNDEYGTYESVDFEFNVYKDDDEVSLKIYVDEDDWDDLSSSDQEDLLQDVCDDVFDEFDDVDISGYLKDGTNKFLEFECENDEDVEIEGGSGDIDDLEDDLNDALEDEDFGELDDIDLDDLSIEVIGDDDDLAFYIDIDLDDYDDEWDDLDEDDIEDFLEEVYDFITDIDDFEDTDVDGYFYDTDDGKKLVKLYESGSNLKYVYY